MSRIVRVDGVDHIIVTPSAAFDNSKMIASVLKSGRKLAVNLQTGVLVIIREPVKRSCILDIGGVKVQLANDREVALLQIDDHVSRAAKRLPVTFFIEQGPRFLYLTTLENNDKDEFLRQVSYAYRKFIV